MPTATPAAPPTPLFPGDAGSWALLLGWVALHFALVLTATEPKDASIRSFLLLTATSVMASLGVLAVNGRPGRPTVLLGLLLAGLVLVGHVASEPFGYDWITNPLTTFLATLACGSTLGRHPDAMAPFLGGGRGGVRRSILLGVLVGLVLGAVNVALGLTS